MHLVQCLHLEEILKLGSKVGNNLSVCLQRFFVTLKMSFDAILGSCFLLFDTVLLSFCIYRYDKRMQCYKLLT